MSSHNPFGPQGWTPEHLGSLAGKTYVITGASAGAGLEATRVLLAKGAHVLMLNRSAAKTATVLTALQQEFGVNAKVSFVQMDLASLASVRQAATAVLASAPQIDALICNAAIAQVAKQELTLDGFESQLGVNHFGHFLLCGLLFARLQASQGRIVVVGSNAYRMGLKKIQFDDLNFDKKYNAWNAYAQSKLAQVMFAYELQRRVLAAGVSVEVQVCHPGASRTSLIRDNASCVMRLLATALSPLAQSAEKGAWPEVMCATQDGLKAGRFYGPTQRGEMVGPVGECVLNSEIAMNRQMANQLWHISEQKTGFTWSL